MRQSGFSAIVIILSIILIIDVAAVMFYLYRVPSQLPVQNIVQTPTQQATARPIPQPVISTSSAGLDLNNPNSENVTVKVFFNNTKLASDPSFLYCDRVFPLSRVTPKTLAAAEAAINFWLKGPTKIEASQGYKGGTKGDVKLNSVKIVDGQAFVDLHITGTDWEKTARQYFAGTCGNASYVSQLNGVMNQFPAVTKKGALVISIDGDQQKFESLIINP